MPEHVHLLVWPGDDPPRMADALYTLKKSVSNRAISYLRRHAPDFLGQMEDRRPNGRVVQRFWQRGGGYDENLYSPAKVWAKIDYIHQNPVRRGLCDNPSEWPWSSARAYETGGAEAIRIEFDSLPVDPRRV